MNFNVKTLTIIASISGLAACGGGSDGAANMKPLAPAESGSATATFDTPSTNVRYNGVVVSNARDDKEETLVDFISEHSRTVSNTGSDKLPSGVIRTLRSNSGKTHAFAFGNEEDGRMYTQFGRSTDSDMPLTGEATFSGSYLGLTSRPDVNVSIRPFRITGETDLTVDFGSGDVSGRITNRRNSTDTSLQFDDITLESATLDADGFFRGQSVGGRPLYVTSENLNGSAFEGVIGGTDGTETTGYVRTDWTAGAAANRYLETGIFSADKQ